jgi:hypothetical protein
LKTGLGSGKKVKALELANAHLKNDLAVARSKLKDAAKENIDSRKQIDNQLDAKHQLRLSLAKIDFKKHKVTTLSHELEKKRKRDDIHHHRLAEIAAREASSKRVMETAASHKTRVKEKALETSTQRVQTMLEIYQGTNSGQFPNGRTNSENVSSRTANLPAKHSQLTLLFPYDGCEQTFTNLGLVTRMTSGNVARPPVAAAPSNQQTTMHTALWSQKPKTVFAIRLDRVDGCCLESSLLFSRND